MPIYSGDTFTRPSAGGGGFGDPLERLPEEVLEDVIDGYVSVARAALDYGVVIQVHDPDIDDYRIDDDATRQTRDSIRRERRQWLKTPPEQVAQQYRDGGLDVLDVIRRYGVVLDWGTGELLEKSTGQYRESLRQRSSDHWG